MQVLIGEGRWSGWSLRCCISSKLPGNAHDAAGVRTIVWRSKSFKVITLNDLASETIWYFNKSVHTGGEQHSFGSGGETWGSNS